MHACTRADSWCFVYIASHACNVVCYLLCNLYYTIAVSTILKKMQSLNNSLSNFTEQSIIESQTRKEVNNVMQEYIIYIDYSSLRTSDSGPSKKLTLHVC